MAGRNSPPRGFHERRMAKANAESLANILGETNTLRSTVGRGLVDRGVPPVTAGFAAGATDMIPVVGDLSGLEDSYDFFTTGHPYLGSAALAASLIGLVPGVGDYAGKLVRSAADIPGGGKAAKKATRWTSGDIKNPSTHMYSPSELAARNLKQPKGTFEEMRKALISGGAKKDELVWSGFDKRFGRRTDPITKDEIVNYLRDNTDMVDEFSNQASGIVTGDAAKTLADDAFELQQRYVDEMLPSEIDYYRDEVVPEMIHGSGEWVQIGDLEPEQLQELVDEQMPNGYTVDRLLSLHANDYVSAEDPTNSAIYSLDELVDQHNPEVLAAESLNDSASLMDEAELRDALGLPPLGDPGNTEYPEYFTPGAEDYKETQFGYDNTLGTRVPDRSHFNDSAPDPEQGLLFHTRAGYFPTTKAGKAYHVGEVQSDWGQSLRRGARPTAEDEIAAGIPVDADQLRLADDMAWDAMNRNGLYGVMSEAPNNARDPGSVFSSPRRFIENADSLTRFQQQQYLKNQFGPYGTLPGTPEYQRSASYLGVSDPTATFISPEDNVRQQRFTFEPSDAHTMAQPVPTPFGSLDAPHEIPRARYLMANRPVTGTPDQPALPLGYDNPIFTAAEEWAKSSPEVAELPDLLAEAGAAKERLAGTRPVGPYVDNPNRNQWIDYALRRSLADAVDSGATHMTLNTGEMAKAMTYGTEAGQSAFYDEILPSRFRKIARQMNPKADLEPVSIITGEGAIGGVTRSVPGLKLTDEIREYVRKNGLPKWMVPLMVGTGAAGVAGSQYRQSEE